MYSASKNLIEGVYSKIYQMNQSFTFPISVYNPLLVLEENGFDRKKNIYLFEKIETIKTIEIVGTIHSDYYKLKNWLEFFNNLKRARTIESIKYYADFFEGDSSNKSMLGLGLLHYKSKYWITGGNNRICIAKIKGIETITIPVSYYSE